MTSKFTSDFRFWPYKDKDGKKLPNPKPKKIYGTVYHIGMLTVCAYLVSTSKGLVIIDTGYEEDHSLMLNNIRQLGFDPKNIKIVLNTHWHWDHTGGNADMVSFSGARLMVGRDDAEIIEKGLYRGKKILKAAPVDKKLKDGDIIELGDVEIKAIHCPGQSRGSMVFLAIVNGQNGLCRVVFTGDATGYKTSPETFEMYYYKGAREDYLRTVEKLKSIDFDLFLGGHSHQIVEELDEKGNPFITRQEWHYIISNRVKKMEDFYRKFPKYLNWEPPAF